MINEITYETINELELEKRDGDCQGESNIFSLFVKNEIEKHGIKKKLKNSEKK